ncbi:cholinesterase-like isoform X2 [Xenia sp. Carnegie-2017]|uniref:cholinesterase-like isoform X2 n=1 Tax=Xenia sp. Carnegie-2017 TaxID=2897299 RepID=UPI001F03DB7C|nr:cholinesterase-like isoform X2 [Xenia sp. Carnegie-2017]
MYSKLILLLVIIHISTIDSKSTNVVETNAGKVQGFIENSSFPGKRIQKFLNIPYAEPPVRFEKAKEIKKRWDDKVYNLNPKKAISCLQKDNFPYFDETEDCLILNVWTPHPRPKNASVMVFIHGGAFKYGSSHEYRYSGSNFVAMGDVILVTLNYRVSVFGFLSDPEKGIKGNLGLFDQRLAMKWVKKNIAAFGGNPDAITLFGESAGSVCVSAHTLSPESWDYFDRAILESGNMLMYWSLSTEKDNKIKTMEFLQIVGCDNSANTKKCLQENVTLETFEKYLNRKVDFMFTPDVDGDFFKDHPRFLFTQGKGKPCPMIFGTLKDEMFFTTSFILSNTRNITEISTTFNETLRETLSHHPRFYEVAQKLYLSECTPSFTEAYRPLVNFLTDWAFTCPEKEESLLRVRIFPEQPVYVFQYAYATAVPGTYPTGTFGFAAHGLDLASVFGVPFKKELPYSDEDNTLSARMILYFTNFAKTGDPNSPLSKLPKDFKIYTTPDHANFSLPHWPPHTIEKEEYLDFESLEKMEVKYELRQKYCEFWDTPLYALHRSTYF